MQDPPLRPSFQADIYIRDRAKNVPRVTALPESQFDQFNGASRSPRRSSCYRNRRIVQRLPSDSAARRIVCVGLSGRVQSPRPICLWISRLSETEHEDSEGTLVRGDAKVDSLALTPLARHPPRSLAPVSVRESCRAARSSCRWEHASRPQLDVRLSPHCASRVTLFETGDPRCGGGGGVVTVYHRGGLASEPARRVRVCGAVAIPHRFPRIPRRRCVAVRTAAASHCLPGSTLRRRAGGQWSRSDRPTGDSWKGVSVPEIRVWK
ncbi:uncharacterized protein B0H18DRAFT_316283 [Fomitopsis serialis]|uniref:uncharacterized protein n=1 Tax=Fomitopsis serialis TaxID=139415 RepID=UPI0020073B97|nr:uncharacterized protein B0H18DRAFT_316283 [Neoantrodia serialis]KAH9936198.1 hypothetical protein B0H18DRAFT_316283 [Neoantrodia serialis]